MKRKLLSVALMGLITLVAGNALASAPVNNNQPITTYVQPQMVTNWTQNSPTCFACHNEAVVDNNSLAMKSMPTAPYTVNGSSITFGTSNARLVMAPTFDGMVTRTANGNFIIIELTVNNDDLQGITAANNKTPMSSVSFSGAKSNTRVSRTVAANGNEVANGYITIGTYGRITNFDGNFSWAVTPTTGASISHTIARKT